MYVAEGRGPGVCQRECKDETASFAQLTLDPECTTVCFQQALGYGEPEAAAAGGPGAGLVHPVKPLKDVGQVLGRNAFTSISHAYLYPVALLLRGYGDGAAWRSVGHRIFQQVAQDLADSVAIDVHPWEAARQLSGY